MTTIMHSLEEDGSSDEAAETDAAVDATAGRGQAVTAAAPPGWEAPAFAAAGPGGGGGPTPYSGPQDPPELQVWRLLISAVTLLASWCSFTATQLGGCCRFTFLLLA